MGTENITEYNLSQHHGSACFYRHPLKRSVVMSEGAHFLSENGAAWLIDAIVAHQFMPDVDKCDSQRWTLTVNEDKSATLIGEDMYCEDYHEMARQEIPFTDFPLKSIELLCSNNGEGKTIYLPKED